LWFNIETAAQPKNQRSPQYFTEPGEHVVTCIKAEQFPCLLLQLSY